MLRKAPHLEARDDRNVGMTRPECDRFVRLNVVDMSDFFVKCEIIGI